MAVINEAFALSELDDFLNFFEFIAYLEKSGQLKRAEIQDIFGYPLDRISSNTALKEYISTYGYENLTKYLNLAKLTVYESKK